MLALQICLRHNDQSGKQWIDSMLSQSSQSTQSHAPARPGVSVLKFPRIDSLDSSKYHITVVYVVTLRLSAFPALNGRASCTSCSTPPNTWNCPSNRSSRPICWILAKASSKSICWSFRPTWSSPQDSRPGQNNFAVHVSRTMPDCCPVKSVADFTLVSADGKEFPVHRAFLSARSPVRAVMISHVTQEKESGGCVLI